ncbi:MAG TPA: sensor domain-containing diguanylate cyclase [Motilibacteraceae bacterium]|nr:sensor domain-containing diguanylate cyclase [Motilibacteraceae bacterium]
MPEHGATAKLRALVESAHEIARARSGEDVLTVAAEAARRVLDADVAGLVRHERERGLARTLVRAGEVVPARERRPGGDYEPIAAQPAAEPAAVTRFELPAGPAGTADPVPAGAAALARYGVTHGLAVPVLVQGLRWGELLLGRTDARDGDFDDEEVDLATLLAAQVAVAVGQAEHLETVHRIAYTDPLTGLGTRRAFEERLDAAFDRHRSDGTVVTVLLADVDGLKEVNDAEGHDAGDALILAVAELMSTATAALPGAFAGRLGGDEMCVLVEGGDPAHVVDDVVAAARALIARSTSLRGRRAVSVGVASTADPVGRVESPSRLLRLADAAMYRAKRSAALVPVVAGRRLPEEVAEALPAVPEIEPGVPERRHEPQRRQVAARASVDPSSLLAHGVAALDALPGGDVVRRLEAVADTAATALDAAAWWVSRVAPGQRLLRTVAWSLYRVPEAPPEPPHDVPAFSRWDVTEFDLAHYPWSARAVAGGGYVLEVGAPGNDPAEDALLVGSGHVGALAAGATVDGVGWLVEIFTDEMSARVVGLVPTLRALVALALLPG